MNPLDSIHIVGSWPKRGDRFGELSGRKPQYPGFPLPFLGKRRLTF